MSKSDNDSFAVNSHSSAAVYERRAEYLAPGSLGLLGTDFSKLSHEDKIALFHEILKQKILRYGPGILCFNGKRSAQVYLGRKSPEYGFQDKPVGLAGV